MHGLFLAAASGAALQLRCAGLSLRWLPLLQSMGSKACRLQHLWHSGSRGRLGSRAHRQSCPKACGIFVPSSVQFSSVTQSCPTLCDPKDCSTPRHPVHSFVPRPGIKATSPALAGGFLTTGPPRKSPELVSDDVIEALDHRPLGISSGFDTVLFFGNLSHFELYFFICKLKEKGTLLHCWWE